MGPWYFCIVTLQVKVQNAISSLVNLGCPESRAAARRPWLMGLVTWNGSREHGRGTSASSRRRQACSCWRGRRARAPEVEPEAWRATRSAAVDAMAARRALASAPAGRRTGRSRRRALSPPPATARHGVAHGPGGLPGAAAPTTTPPLARRPDYLLSLPPTSCATTCQIWPGPMFPASTTHVQGRPAPGSGGPSLHHASSLLLPVKAGRAWHGGPS